MSTYPSSYFLFHITILDSSITSIEENIEMAEQYLVKVFKRSTNCKNFDELRIFSYHLKCALIDDLPPTSNTIKLHILRAYYIVYCHINCLEITVTSIDPKLFGFVEENDLLLPEKVEILIPPVEEFSPNCTCKSCKINVCICFRNQIPCCKFCFCKINNTCNNIYDS